MTFGDKTGARVNAFAWIKYYVTMSTGRKTASSLTSRVAMLQNSWYITSLQQTVPICLNQISEKLEI